MSSGDVQLEVLKTIESAEEGVPQIYGNMAVVGLSDANAELFNGIISTQKALGVDNMQVEESGSVPSLRFNAEEPTLIRCGEGVLGEVCKIASLQKVWSLRVTTRSEFSVLKLDGGPQRPENGYTPTHQSRCVVRFLKVETSSMSGARSREFLAPGEFILEPAR
jgi:hypothetical protein